MDPTTAFFLLLVGIVLILSARALLDYFLEPARGARLVMNVVAGTLCVVLLGLVVLLAIALRQDPHACPWNGCS